MSANPPITEADPSWAYNRAVVEFEFEAAHHAQGDEASKIAYQIMTRWQDCPCGEAETLEEAKSRFVYNFFAARKTIRDWLEARS